MRKMVDEVRYMRRLVDSLRASASPAYLAGFSRGLDAAARKKEFATMDAFPDDFLDPEERGYRDGIAGDARRLQQKFDSPSGEQ